MSRRIDHDGLGSLQVRFPFDRGLVDRIKTLPRRQWIASERYWQVPETDVVAVVDLFAGRAFVLDDATRAAYIERGGTDLDDPGSEPVEKPSPAHVDDYSVSRLNRRVADAIASAFPGEIWLVGEISGFNKSAHKRHVGFQLVERDDAGGEIAQVGVILFEGARRAIGSRLAAADDPFRLEDEIEVRLRVAVELYEPWGLYRARVEDIDVGYTVGEAARRREEVIRKLTEAGLVGVNSELPLPKVPLRLGVITSLGSDAYNDVLRTLQESGFAFTVTTHGARVQGRSTEPSVLNALDWFRDRVDRFDAVLICRGGGSRSDLSWFDTERIGRAVARFPIPVIAGIGHEQDRSVPDAVARPAKTPTAAAAMMVDRVADALETIADLGAVVMDATAGRLRDEAATAAERAARLVRAARGLLDQEGIVATHRRRAIVVGARRELEVASERLRRDALDVPRRVTALLATRRVQLETAVRQVLQGVRRDIGAAARNLDERATTLGPRTARAAARERERVDGRARRLDLVDPRRVLERGYAVLRKPGGPAIRSIADAPDGTELDATLQDGTVALQSRGPRDGQG